MVITDLDGTLLNRHGQLSDRNRAALDKLGERGIPRVVATGRSPYSARSVLPPDFPIDYLIFSTGAGIIDWHSAELLRPLQFDRQHADQVLEALVQRKLDFMAHAPIPANHYFEYSCINERANPDFTRRLERYTEFASTGDGRSYPTVTQFLAIECPIDDPCYDDLQRELTFATVVLATSPLDHESRWIEIFPKGAGKGAAAAWLAQKLGIDRAHTVAIGNDYNDVDLLVWAQQSFVVANAPAELQQQYTVVADYEADGFAAAVTAAGCS